MEEPKERLKRELLEYLNHEANMDKNDRLKMLMNIFEKHFIFEKSLHLVTEHDILSIASMSKTAYANLSLPLFVGKRKMEYDDLRTIANIEAFINYANEFSLVKKEIVINYKKD